MNRSRNLIPALAIFALATGSCSEPDATLTHAAEPAATTAASPPIQAVPARPAPEPPPVAQPGEREALRVSGDVVRPERIGGERLDLAASGCPLERVPLVILELTIDETGTVTSVDFLGRPPGECVAQYIAEAVAAWRFKPATLDDAPVAVKYNLTVRSHYR